VIRRIKVQGQPRETVSETPSQIIKKLGIVVHAYYLRYMGSINRRMTVQASPGIKAKPY
jgi:hypothetical protein